MQLKNDDKESRLKKLHIIERDSHKIRLFWTTFFFLHGEIRLPYNKLFKLKFELTAFSFYPQLGCFAFLATVLLSKTERERETHRPRVDP